MCDPTEVTCDTPPYVSITPFEKTWSGTLASDTVWVTVEFCTGANIVQGSETMVLDGMNARQQFAVQNVWKDVLDGRTCRDYQQWSGVLHISPGSHTFGASFADQWGRQGAGSAAYTYTATAAPPPAVYGVQVTPDAQAQYVGPSNLWNAVFEVRNTGNRALTFDLVPQCSGAGVEASCTASHTQILIGPASSANVAVNYRSTGSGQGEVRLGASATLPGGTTVQDEGTVLSIVADVPHSRGFRGDSVSTSYIDRGACVTVAVGPGAAFECGNLRLAYALPTTTVLNRPRTPVLLYSSQTARFVQLLSTVWSPPTDRPQPDSVKLTGTVTLPGGSQTFRSGSFGTWAVGTPRRLTFPFNANDAAPGAYPYSLTVVGYWGGQAVNFQQPAAEFVVVNHSNSPFGAGWWLAGLERVQFLSDGTRALWTGGDGSARIYTRVGTNTLVARSYARPDTLHHDPSTLEWYRRLPGGARVHYNAVGHHVRTVNALGQATRFTYDAQARLDSVVLPRGGAYRFTYSGPNASDVLVGVSAPGPTAGGPARVVTVRSDAGRRLTRIIDPFSTATDSTFVGFGYPNAANNRIASLTDRNGSVTEFTHSVMGTLTRSRLITGLTSAPVSDAWYFPVIAETQGVAVRNGGGGPVPPDGVYTRIDGPRPDNGDSTRIWVDRYGAPTQVRDPLGNVTNVYRQDPRFPALVTQVTHPNGRTLSASYDARGNLVAQTDWATSATDAQGRTRYATTTYDYDPRWDAVIRATLPEGEVTQTGYDEFGRIAWSQPGFDRARRDTATYYAPQENGWGLVHTVRPPLGTPQSFEYDALGNLNASSVMDGGRQVRTEQIRDAIGRVTRVTNPDSSEVRTTYDDAARIVTTETFGTGTEAYNRATAGTVTDSARSLFVRSYLNRMGQPDSVSRWQAPATEIGVITTRWIYDAAGRAVVEIAPDGTPGTSADNPRDSTIYNVAGQAERTRNRRGLQARMTYDVMGRLIRRQTDAYTYEPWNITLPLGKVLRFPLYGADSQGALTVPNTNGLSLRISGDTATFAYDPVTGAMTGAVNRDAVVRRSYYPNGALQSETQRIRTYVGTDTSTHSYRLQYTYDLNGRRTSMTHPEVFGGGATAYHYDAVTGGLHLITDNRGGQYRYSYNAAGQVDTLTRGTVRETFSYDPLGRLATRVETESGGVRHHDVLGYDWQTGKVSSFSSPLQVAGGGSAALTYDGRGALFMMDEVSRIGRGSQRVELYRTDALQNQRRSEVWSGSLTDLVSNGPPEAYSRTYGAGTGRLVSGTSGEMTQPTDANGYDAAGNATAAKREQLVATPYKRCAGSGFMKTCVENAGAYLFDYTTSYYDGDNRLRVVDRRGCLRFTPEYIDTEPECDPNLPPAYEARSAFEEYRYDALGRRVLVRTRQDYVCNWHCLRQTRRMVWDGDQLLYEVAAPGATSATAAQMERDTGLITPFGTGEYFFQTGRVEYVHGHGIDAPLAFYREEYSDSIPGASFIPQANWRGVYDMGVRSGLCYTRTWTNQLTDPPIPEPGADSTGGPGTSGTETLCADVDWPAQYTWAYYQYRRGYSGPYAWMGSLAFDSRDASGLHYRRNRFYNAEQGRFTQEDPIGMAGGINVYGFADGDPVSYSDPYGLCPIPLSNCFQKIANWGARQDGAIGKAALYGGSATAAAIQTIAEVGAFVQGTGCDERAGGRVCYASGPALGPGNLGRGARVAARLVGGDGGLRTSRTVARQLSGERSYIPVNAILETVRGGERIPDPQGVANHFMYRVQAQGGTLEVLVDEAANVINHVLYRSK